MATSKPKRKKKRSRSIRTTDPAQSARFLEAAKKLNVDESGEAFERALSGLLLPSNREKKRKRGK